MKKAILTIGRLCRSLNHGLGRLEELFLCLLLLAMIVLSCVQICLRDFVAGGFLWLDPLQRYMVLWAGMFGAAVATRRSKHITIDLSSHLLPEVFKPWLHLALNFFGAGVTGVLTWAAIIFVVNEASFGEASGFLKIPSWQMNLVFPLAFGLIACRFLGLALANIKELVTSCRQEGV